MNGEQTTTDTAADVQPRSKFSNLAIGFLLIVAAFLAYNFFSTDPEIVSTSDSGINNEDDIAAITDELDEDITTDEEETIILDQDPNQNDQLEEINLDESVANDIELAEGEYLVQGGDTLWKIAENELDDGFLWREIAELNNLSESQSLEVGSVLRLPEVAAATTELEETEDITPEDTAEVVDEEPDEIADLVEDVDLVELVEDVVAEAEAEELAQTSLDPEPTAVTLTEDQVYVVQKGDNLWKIAQEFYGDGANWNLIFDLDENNLSNYTPEGGIEIPLIHTGNVLVIPANG